MSNGYWLQTTFIFECRLNFVKNVARLSSCVVQARQGARCFLLMPGKV